MPRAGSVLRSASAVLAIALVGLAPAVVHAHTDLDFTLPTDTATVGDPVAEITVAFTNPVTLVGNGFEVLDPQGNILAPFAVTDDDRVFRLQMDPPLAGGEIGVRYEVTAEDGHVLSGGFRFTVDAPVPTTTVPTTTIVAGEERAPATVASTTPGTEPPPTTTTIPVVVGDDTPAEAAAAEVPAAAADAVLTEAEVAAADSVEPIDDDDGLVAAVLIAIAAAVLGGVGAYFVLRSRTSG